MTQIKISGELISQELNKRKVVDTDYVKHAFNPGEEKSLTDAIGDFNGLVTTSKDNIVNAINEAYNHGGGGGGYILPTADTNTKGGIKIGAGLKREGEDSEHLTIRYNNDDLNINDGLELEINPSYKAYIKQLEDRIAALEAIVNPHSVTITCKSSVSAGGEVLSILVENNFEADNIELTCTGGLTPEGSGSNWVLTIPVATSAHQFTLTAKASKGGGAQTIVTKNISQPKAAITINCSKTTISASGETITVNLMNNFEAAASTYELVSTAEGVSISSLGGGSFSVVIGAYTGSTARNIQLTASATKSSTTIQTTVQVTQQAYVQTFDCWIGHGMSVEEITGNDSFKISGNTSMASLRGNHIVEYTPEDAGDRIYVVVPKSFNINKEQIIFGVYPNEGVFPMDSEFEEDIVINNITYSVVSSTRLDSDKYMITFKQ